MLGSFLLSISILSISALFGILGGKLHFGFTFLGTFLSFEFLSRRAFNNVNPLQLLDRMFLSFAKFSKVLLKITVFEVLLSHLKDGVELLLMLFLCFLTSFISTLSIIEYAR